MKLFISEKRMNGSDCLFDQVDFTKLNAVFALELAENAYLWVNRCEMRTFESESDKGSVEGH